MLKMCKPLGIRQRIVTYSEGSVDLTEGDLKLLDSKT